MYVYRGVLGVGIEVFHCISNEMGTWILVSKKIELICA